MKFDGTSVADVDRLRAVAQRLVAAREAGKSVAIVCKSLFGSANKCRSVS
jgi:aspartate kinase